MLTVLHRTTELRFGTGSAFGMTDEGPQIGSPSTAKHMSDLDISSLNAQEPVPKRLRVSELGPVLGSASVSAAWRL